MNSTVRKASGNTMIQRHPDKRSLRTRAWIVQAFNELIFKRTYSDLPTDNIIKRAGVGRSTFYEHFRNKDEVLLHSVSWILSAFADAVSNANAAYRIRGVLDHISDQKPMAQPLLAGPGGAAMAAELSNLIEIRLDAQNASRGTTLAVPTRLAARQVAAAQLSLLCNWLEDTSSCSSTTLATAICRSSQGLVASLGRGEAAAPMRQVYERAGEKTSTDSTNANAPVSSVDDPSAILSLSRFSRSGGPDTLTQHCFRRTTRLSRMLVAT